MKKLKMIFTIAVLLICGYNVNAQKKGAFEALNTEVDEMGITGQYFFLNDKKALGLRFVKEADGKIINQLHWFEKKLSGEPQAKFSFKESYYTKNQVKLFYEWAHSNSSAGYVELIELEKGVIAQISQSEYTSGNPVPLETKRKVTDVLIKDQSKLTTWDLETAQAKVDMIIASLNTEKLEKEKAEWMKNEAYAKNVDKVVFAAQWYHLQKQGYPDKLAVSGADFKTELDMAGNMNFMGFFSVPPSVKYPGQQINIEYEMGGKKTNRETLRKKSAAWSNMVPIIETKKFEYRQSPTRAIREYNQYQSQFVQDYAAIQCLYDNKDKLKVGQTYDFTVRIYAHRDGENGAVLAEGTVKLKYTDKAKIAFEGDPTKPQEKGIFATFEDFLNE